MSPVQIIDTFPTFLSFWSTVSDSAIDEQIELWYSEYMASWPELRQKQIDDYAKEGVDWHQIAKEMVFPYLDNRLPAMKGAHAGLLDLCAPIFDLARERLQFDADIVIVIYVGLGCGAGWVTNYAGKPAILFGLENLVECHYETQPALTGLIAHEIGHVAHFNWRAKNELAHGAGPWWQLYIEGFAQRCEHVILGQDLWHMKVMSPDEKWLGWCQENKAWLAAEYLRTVEEDKPVSSFFGSWYDIRNRKQTGYYLSHEIIRELESSLPYNQMALLDEPDYGMRTVLDQLAISEE